MAKDFKLHAAFYPNTESCIDLKLLTRKPGRIGIGNSLSGALSHDREDHFLFIENGSGNDRKTVNQRNPHIYMGRYINVNRKSDGTIYPPSTDHTLHPTSRSSTSVWLLLRSC